MSQSFAEALSWVPVSATFSATLGRAHEYALAQSHRQVTLEHLLLALADDPDAGAVLQNSNIDIGRLTHDASAHLGHNDDRFAPGQPLDPSADEALVRILDYAAAAARQSRRREINGAIVLAAIVGEGRSIAASLLQAQGLTFEGAIKALQRAPVTQPAPRAPQSASPPPAVPPPAPISPNLDPPTPAASPAVEPGPSLGGSATQTNEQILANVRRRIDANRAASKPAPAPAAREPYPIPAAPAPAPAARAEPQPSPAAPDPIEFAPPPPPAPPTVRQQQQPSPLPPLDAEMAADEARAGDAYTGLYPELPGHAGAPPSVSPRPHDDGLVAEARTADPPRPAEASYAPPPAAPSRRPPPLPPGPSPVLADPPPSPLRPRRLGAPDVPPSSIPWPAPVLPQPSALPPPPPIPYPPNAAAPSRSEPEFDPLDGGIAGAPYPEPDSVSARPVEPLPVPSPARRPPVAKSTRPEIDHGQLAENIPRTMQVGKSEIVEVRIARGAARAIADGMQGSGQAYLRDLVVTKAMSVRLRSLDRGFAIDPASPETQWIDNTTGLGDDVASWRWNVTPLRSGGGRLQLLVSARTIASDGLSADTALPDQVFEIKVKADHARSFRKVAGWIGLMVAGGVLSRFGQGSVDTILAMWRGFQ